MYAYPVFRRHLATSSRLLLAPTAEAKRLENVAEGEVLTEARTFVSTNGGDPSDQFLVLAHCKLQFGKYSGQRFRWLLENSLGYAVYLRISISSEAALMSPLSESKRLFLRYTSQIREMREECEKYQRKQEMKAEACETGDQGSLMVEFGDFQGWSMKEVYEDKSKEARDLIEYLVKADVWPNSNMAMFKTYVIRRRASSRATSPPAASSHATVSSATPSSPSTPSSTTTTRSSTQIQTGVQETADVKAPLDLSKNIPTSQQNPLLSPPRGGEPPAKHLAQRQLFTPDTSIPPSEEADDKELVFAAAQCERQLSADPADLADSQLPSPRVKMDQAPSTPGTNFKFILPAKKAEQPQILEPAQRPASAVTRERPIAPTTGIMLPVLAPVPLSGTIILSPVMPAPTITFSGATTFSAGFIPPATKPPPTTAPVSRYTQRNRRRRALEEKRGIRKRKYIRAVNYNTCSKCGQPKTKEYGHSRYRNATFCLKASNGQSLEEWLAEQRQRDEGGSPPPLQ
ncbi:uncharacterized protein LOC112151342 isoform X2 [Oryzias melastigma]|uniref:uncharacterized protein LOC112151342 isoform X2 n=1 Tax=Oryzias melastigma TaxID=30732 RepID=UPI000CF80DA1|nr:uncharacterized protein LOC112151342 isoform X2 [Oryzias melastigma]